MLRKEAVVIVGDLMEQGLSRQVLELAANDRDESVRVAALVAVRPWTRLTHLYFLETAMGAKSQFVRSEAVRSIALLSPREVQPSLVARIERMVTEANPPIVRRAALDALKGWKRIDWEMLRVVVEDQEAGDSLRLYAIELSDSIPSALIERTPTLIDLVRRETSIGLGWWAFKRLKVVARSDRNFIQGLSKLLAGTSQYNTATVEMAGFLRSVGVKAEYKDGGWKVASR